MTSFNLISFIVSLNLNIEHLFLYIVFLNFLYYISIAHVWSFLNGMNAAILTLISFQVPAHSSVVSNEYYRLSFSFLLFEYYFHHNRIFCISGGSSNYLRQKYKTLGLNLLIRLSENSHWGKLTHCPMCLISHLWVFEIHSIYIHVKNFCTSAISTFPIAKM